MTEEVDKASGGFDGQFLRTSSEFRSSMTETVEKELIDRNHQSSFIADSDLSLLETPVTEVEAVLSNEAPKQPLQVRGISFESSRARMTIFERLWQ